MSDEAIGAALVRPWADNTSVIALMRPVVIIPSVGEAGCIVAAVCVAESHVMMVELDRGCNTGQALKSVLQASCSSAGESDETARSEPELLLACLAVRDFFPRSRRRWRREGRT